MLRAIFIFTFVFCVALPLSRAEETEPEDHELGAFLGRTELRNLRWRSFRTDELKVYYCLAEPPRAGAAGIELGGKPFLIPVKETDIQIDGTFGRFAVKWFRRTIKDGSRQAETTFRCGVGQWAHVILEAPDEIGVSRFISELGRLALFAPVAKEDGYAGPGLAPSKLRSAAATEPQASPRPATATAQ